MKPTIRASSAPRRLACPGSRTVDELVPQRQGTEGHDGEWCHRQTALLAISQLGAHPPEGGLPPTSYPATFTPKASDWIPPFQLRFIRDTIPADWSLVVELELDAEFERFITTGHPDVVGFNPDVTEVIIIDWKDGYLGVDPADENDQFLVYMVQLKLNFPTLRKITFWCVQPRLSEEDDEHPRFSSVVVEDAGLDSCVRSLEERMNAALDQPHRLISGSHCKYCVGLRCPCLQKELYNMELELTDEMLAELRAGMDDAKLADLFLAQRTLTNPIKDLKTIMDERSDKVSTFVASNGQRITPGTEGAGIEVTDPVGFDGAVIDMIPDRVKLATARTYNLSRLTDLVALQMNVPKGGKSGTSARDILNARTSPFFKTKTRRIYKVST